MEGEASSALINGFDQENFTVLVSGFIQIV